MGKDPAFLFYSNDFYEGTRMMLPEERACYIDLLIYQHQKRTAIPNDLRRLQMYCSGCSIGTIQNVLDQKFEQTVNGWLNQKLDHLVGERSKHKPKKIASATFAGLISGSKLNKMQKEKCKKSFKINDFILKNDQLITDETLIKSTVREWFKNLVDHMVDNLENETVNENRNKRKGGVGEKQNGPTDEIYLDIGELKLQVKNESTWKETICRNVKEAVKGFSMADVENQIEIFFKIIQNDGETDKTLKDFKKHFNRWHNNKLKKQTENEKSENSPNYAKRANDAVDRFFGKAR